jgi:hypothetical protein
MESHPPKDVIDLSTTDENPTSTTQPSAATPYAMCLTKGGAAAAPAPVGQARAPPPGIPTQSQSIPLAIPATPPQQTALVVNLPPGVVPGHFLRAMGPDGVVFTFQAPMGSSPGCPVRVVLPTQTAVLSVRIPDGAQPGQEISAKSPTGVVLRLATGHCNRLPTPAARLRTGHTRHSLYISTVASCAIRRHTQLSRFMYLCAGVVVDMRLAALPSPRACCYAYLHARGTRAGMGLAHR